MDREPPLPEANVGDLVDIPAGEIVLRDEGSRTSWTVEVAPFRLAPYPVTRERYGAVVGTATPGPAGAPDAGDRRVLAGGRPVLQPALAGGRARTVLYDR